MSTTHPKADDPVTSASSPNIEVSEKPSSGVVPTPDPAESSPRQIHGIQWSIAVTAILSTTLLFSLDNTIVADVQPSIIRDFGEVTKLSWLGSAYALGSAATILPWSRIYGIIDIKWLYIAHVLTFETGSALCGGAPSMNALIVGRAIAGLGASGMYVGCLTYLSVLTTMKERPVYMGLVGLMWGLGTILGPVIGGAFVDSNATWRWAFYINLVIGALFAPVYFLLLPSVGLQAGVTLTLRLARYIDWLGIISFAGFMCCFIMAITFGGSLYAWNSGAEIALWVVTGCLLVVFGLTQLVHPFVGPDDRLFPVGFLKSPTLLMLQTLTFISSMSLLVPTYYIPLFFQFVKGGSAINAAIHLLAFIVVVVVFSMINGSLMVKLGYYMPWYLLGGILVLVGAALTCTITPTTTTSAIYGYSVLIGAGVGLFLQAGFSVTQAILPPPEIPSAIGFMSLGQSLGIVISLAIAGTIYQTEAAKNIAKDLPGSDGMTVRQTITGTNSAYFQNLPPATRILVVEGIVRAMNKVYFLVVVGGALTVILACLLPVIIPPTNFPVQAIETETKQRDNPFSTNSSPSVPLTDVINGDEAGDTGKVNVMESQSKNSQNSINNDSGV